MALKVACVLLAVLTATVAVLAMNLRSLDQDMDDLRSELAELGDVADVGDASNDDLLLLAQSVGQSLTELRERVDFLEQCHGVAPALYC